MKKQFQSALPNHISVDKFIRTLQTAVGTTPALVQSEKNSLYGACMKAAQDGLLPDGKEAAIVTFRNKKGDNIAQYMPMVGGILKKVRNSGELASITSQVVYKNDPFKYWVDEDGEHIEHKPLVFGDRGEPVGVYALAKTKDGAVYIETMTADDINKIKQVSRGKNGPWSGPFHLEMWKKSAIRRLSKKLPMSTDLEFTIKADDGLYDLDQTDDVPDTPPVEKDTTKPNNLAQAIEEQEEKEVTPKEPTPPPEEPPI